MGFQILYCLTKNNPLNQSRVVLSFFVLIRDLNLVKCCQTFERILILKFSSGLQWFWWSQTQPTKKQKYSKISFGSFYYSEHKINSLVFELWSVVCSHFCATQSAWSLWMVLVSFMCAPYVFSTKGEYLWRQGLCVPFSWCWTQAWVIASCIAWDALQPGYCQGQHLSWPWNSYWFRASILANSLVSCLPPT